MENKSMNELLNNLAGGGDVTGGDGPSSWWTKVARALEEADGAEIWMDLTCQGCARTPVPPPPTVPEIVLVEADADTMVSDIGFYNQAGGPFLGRSRSIASSTANSSNNNSSQSENISNPDNLPPHLLIHRKALAERAAARDHRGQPLHPTLNKNLYSPPLPDHHEEKDEDEEDEEEDVETLGFMDVVKSCFHGSNAGKLILDDGNDPIIKMAFSSGALVLEERPPPPPFKLPPKEDPLPVVEGTVISIKQRPRSRSRSRSRRRAMHDQLHDQLLHHNKPIRTST